MIWLYRRIYDNKGNLLGRFVDFDFTFASKLSHFACVSTHFRVPRIISIYSKIPFRSFRSIVRTAARISSCFFFINVRLSVVSSFVLPKMCEHNSRTWSHAFVALWREIDLRDEKKNHEWSLRTTNWFQHLVNEFSGVPQMDTIFVAPWGSKAHKHSTHRHN